MKLFRKCISVFLAALFLAYSGGIGFSLHDCEHCHQVKVYVFEHPDCCPASEAEHHHEKSAKETQHSCCSHEENHFPENVSPDATTAHCHECCVSEYQFYKINSQYVSSQDNKIVQPIEDCPVVLFDLLKGDEQLFSLAETKILNPPKEILPLLPGGDVFLVFSHQLLFYA
jgi:hypothetical protein